MTITPNLLMVAGVGFAGVLTWRFICDGGVVWSVLCSALLSLVRFRMWTTTLSIYPREVRTNLLKVTAAGKISIHPATLGRYCQKALLSGRNDFFCPGQWQMVYLMPHSGGVRSRSRQWRKCGEGDSAGSPMAQFGEHTKPDVLATSPVKYPTEICTYTYIYNMDSCVFRRYPPYYCHKMFGIYEFLRYMLGRNLIITILGAFFCSALRRK
jgi:hypothetical protein